jgi:methylthioribose-1-phosphate isomerase
MRPLAFDHEHGTLRLLDQTRLPTESVWLECRTAREAADAILQMRVRGAPVIGVVAAYGMALGAREYAGHDTDEFLAHLERVGRLLRGTRPTAVNLGWAIERCLARAGSVAREEGVPSARNALAQLADAMAEEDAAGNRRLGQYGLKLVPERASVLTHCNTGSLATVEYGTALGIIRAAHEAGRDIHVYVDETRPFLQGARLTAWELRQDGIPMTLITDSMAGYFMAQGKVDLVVIGADRIAANGDTANKIGSYSLAVLADAHGIPFYVAAPTSTIDLSIKSGAEIPIEERSPREIVRVGQTLIAPEDVAAAHPAFDVTPACLITAFVTERGIVLPPYEESLRETVLRGQPVELEGDRQ